jgi:predicted permease
VVVGLAARRRVSDQVFRLFYRRVLVTLTFIRGCLVGWVFHGAMRMVGVIAVVAASEVLCAYVLARAGPHRHRPLAGFAGHSNTGYWGLPVGAVMFGSAGVVFVTLYEMLAAPRVAPAMRRLQRHAPVATTAAERSTDLSPVVAALLGLGARAVMTPSSWAAGALLPLAVAGGAVGAVSFGLSVPTRPPGKEHVARASAVVAVRAVLLPAPLLLFALLGLCVPAVAWVVVTGLAPFNTVILARLYGYDIAFGATVVGLSALVSVLTALVFALGRVFVA